MVIRIPRDEPMSNFDLLAHEEPPNLKALARNRHCRTCWIAGLYVPELIMWWRVVDMFLPALAHVHY